MFEICKNQLKSVLSVKIYCKLFILSTKSEYCHVGVYLYFMASTNPCNTQFRRMGGEMFFFRYTKIKPAFDIWQRKCFYLHFYKLYFNPLFLNSFYDPNNNNFYDLTVLSVNWFNWWHSPMKEFWKWVLVLAAAAGLWVLSGTRQ